MRSATGDWYRRAAERDLAGLTSLHVEWAAGVAGDDEVLDLIDRLPRERRQPSLLFSVAALLGAPAADYGQWRAWLVEHWPSVAAESAGRRTQTNEVGRCAPLLAALDRIDGPIALLEVGASAGLCLLVDRYSYRFGDAPLVGSGSPVIECAVSGPGQAPRTLPRIVWRGGLDLDPLSVDDPRDVAWLDALLPPDRPDRRARLHAAIATARADRPVVEAGDALADLERVAAAAPDDATLVVASLGTLVYLPPADRTAFPQRVAALRARLVTLEATGIADRPDHRTAVEETGFVLALDGERIAAVTPHGDRLAWFG